MHNFDRTQLDTDFDEDEAFEAESFEAFDDDDEFNDDETDGFDESEHEAFADDMPDDRVPGGMVFSETEEAELAAELLELAGDDEEMEEFFLRGLRKAFKRVRRGARRVLKKTKGVRRRVRRRLTRRLKKGLRRVAKTALRGAGTAAGTFFGGPVGAAVGGRVGNAVGNALGLELEGLSPEDKDFAVARQIVRMTGDAMAEAMAIDDDLDDDEAGDQALRAVIRRHAPSAKASKSRPSGATSGRWVRRGSKIVLMGV